MTFAELAGWHGDGPWFQRHYEFGAYRPYLYLRSLGFLEAGAVLAGEPVVYSPALGWLSIRGTVDEYVVLWSYAAERFLVIERGLGMDVWWME